MTRSIYAKELMLSGLAISGAWITRAVGGWDKSLQTLIIFMAVDFVSGLLIAAVWKLSPKSSSGALESNAAGKGLIRKGAFLLVVLIANQLDETLGLNGFVRTATVYGFMGVEGLSIVENLGIMGVPMPAVVRRAFEQLKTKMNDLPGEKSDGKGDELQ